MKIHQMGMVAAILHGLTSSVALAQEASTPKPASAAGIFQHMQTPMPDGPFSSWPENGRAAAVRGVLEGCTFLSVMLLDNYRGPDVASRPGVGALVLARMVQKMPNDSPDRSDNQKREVQEYSIAKSADPNFPDPEVIFKPSNR